MAEGCGNAKVFTRPYHAWTYGADGKLRGRPDERPFAGFEKDEISLRPLPVVEKYGMIWLAPASGPMFDIDPQLAGLKRNLTA